MKHVIIGTAGHVDHGKTMLVQALTGIATDRLEEEKKRGITIELGFAYLDFADGLRVGIVDVPGHEKFIKNMLAGSGGIDLGMLVVAANEGVMPQTREHLDILSLLGLQDGLVVITKQDLVEDDWLEMVKEDIAAAVQGTFLAGKPVLAVSAQSGQGIAALKEQLHELVEAAAAKDLAQPFRLPVDRIFPIEGFGTVVTGTLIEGSLCVGDMTEILPSGNQARVRNLQVHGQDVETAFAGQRVAVNLAGVKKGEIVRGDSIAKPGTVHCTQMLDVRLRVLPSSARTIRNASLLHLHHGSRVLLAKAVLLDCDELAPGQSGYVQLRLQEPLPAKDGDHFVVRFYSPMETIGGGTVLDVRARKHKRHDAAALSALQIREQGSLAERILQMVSERGLAFPDAGELQNAFSVPLAEWQQEWQLLQQHGALLEIVPGRFSSQSFLDALAGRCLSALSRYHQENPLQEGMKVAEFRQKLLPGLEPAVADAVLARFVDAGQLRLLPDRVALADFKPERDDKQEQIAAQLLQAYLAAGVEPAVMEDVLAALPSAMQKGAKKILESLVSNGELVLLTPQLCLHKQVYADVLAKTTQFFQQQSTLSLAEFRDLLGTSRKYALAILEYFDRNRFTQKQGEVRIWLR